MTEMFSYFTGLQGAAIAENLVLLETALAKNMYAPAELRIPENTYNKKSYSEVCEIMAPFDFNTYVKTLEITKPDSIIVGTPQFFSNLNVLFSDFTLDTWKNYLRWNLMRDAAPYLNQDLVDLNFGFYWLGYLLIFVYIKRS